MHATHTCHLPCDIIASRLSPNRTRQLVGYGGHDGALYVYPFMGASPQARLERLSAPVTSLGFSSNQSSVVGGSGAGELLMWSLATEQVVRTFKGHRSMITDIEVHTCDYLIATVSMDSILRIWDIRKNVRVQLHNDAKAPLHRVQFSPNVKWVATGCERGIVRLYNLGKASLEASLELHGGAITSLHFHPEMYFLLVGCEDGTVALWNLETFKAPFRSRSTNAQVDCVRFGGTQLLASSSHQLHIWDTRSLSEEAAQIKDAPWGGAVDMTYASFSHEVWFVEANGSTTLTGHFPIGSDGATESIFKPKINPRPLSTALEVLSRPTKEISSGTDPTALRTGRKDVNHVVEKPDFVTPPHGSPAPSRSPLELPQITAVDCDGSEMEVVEQLLAGGVDVSSTLRRRATHLGVVRSLWQQDQHAALQHLKRLCEEGTEGGVVHDFLVAMQQQRMKEKVTLDCVSELLGVVQCALQSPDDPLAMMALRTLRSVNTKFRSRLEEGQRRARVLFGSGSNDPQRANNSECVLKLGQCSAQVLSLTYRQDVVGEEARRLIPELSPPKTY